MDLVEELCDPEDQEFPGEKYLLAHWQKISLDEEICESETASSSEVGPTSGNILDRIIPDPHCRRPPRLGKWPTYLSKSEKDVVENVHQFKAAQQPTQLSQMCSLRITSDPNIFRQPAIIGTIGPNSLHVSEILELLEAGMNVARISMAHPNPCSSKEVIRHIIEASNQFRTMKDFNIPIAIMMDLKGPEIRTGAIASGHGGNTTEVFLKENDVVKITSNKIYEHKCSNKIIYIDYKGSFCKSLENTIIYMAGGLIQLKVTSMERSNLLCTVEVGGILQSYQTVFIARACSPAYSISEYDYDCLNLAAKMDVDIVVIPRVRNEEVIKRAKNLLADILENNNILIFAKISCSEALENIDSILRVADGIVIKKNDLALEITPQKMFVAQKEIIGKCNRLGKPVVCTAELSHQKSSSDVIKRMEMNEIGAAIVDGADGIILTKETCLEDEGAKAVAQLSQIMREAEAVTMQKPFYFDLVDEQIPSIEPSKAIALAAVQIANKIDAAAILAITTSGITAQLLSWFRPRRPVIAITRVGKTARQLNLWRAVLPLHFSAPLLPDWFHDVRARFDYGISYGKSAGIIDSGDLLVLVSGYRKKSGFTNCIRVVFAALDRKGFWDDITSYYASSTQNTK